MTVPANPPKLIVARQPFLFKTLRFLDLARQKFAPWLLAAYWITLLFGTHWPVVPDLREYHTNDKQVHFFAYGLLMVLVSSVLAPSFDRSQFQRGMRWFLLYVGICLYGALDELTQPLTGRSCEWLDWVADATGAGVAAVLCFVITELCGRLPLTHDQSPPAA